MILTTKRKLDYYSIMEVRKIMSRIKKYMATINHKKKKYTIKRAP